ncbi:MAG: hypothetical protein JSU70_00870 [Phycisphaerales bacterium]|nr:MAG: hypothetical protein JSU70_00870 [Phycisphaerales bacterium]
MVRRFLFPVFVVWIVPCRANIIIPEADMPYETIRVTIQKDGDSLNAHFRGEYYFTRIDRWFEKMYFPIPPDANNVYVEIDGTAAPWHMERFGYYTGIDEMLRMTTISWDGPFPESGVSVTVEYDHSLIERPAEWLYYYPFTSYDAYRRVATRATIEMILPGGLTAGDVFVGEIIRRYSLVGNELTMRCTFPPGWLDSSLLVSIMPETISVTTYVDPDGDDFTGDGTELRPFRTIQRAIDNAEDGYVIIVGPGRYVENINCGGKNIVLRSTEPANEAVVAGTVIDGNDTGPVVTFSGAENSHCVLAGFTVTNGYAKDVVEEPSSGDGGGISGNGSTSTIADNIICENIAGSGGGIAHCRGIIENNMISQNRARQGGGLAFCDGIIQNNAILDNVARSAGGGLDQCYGIIRNNVVSRNLTLVSGGGMHKCGEIANNVISRNSASYGSAIYDGGLVQNNTIWANKAHDSSAVLEYCSRVTHCIIWENTPQQIRNSVFAGYNDVQGADTSSENMTVDPLFVDPNNGDFHLKSQAGRWDPAAQGWVYDEVTSPCIDAGDPMSPVGQEPFPNGGQINIGAYSGTAEASKSYFGEPVCETIVAGDINGDCKVNFNDFRIMTLHWLEGDRP